MKRTKLIYWISTGIFFVFESVMPALTSHTQLAIDGIRHLGYPDYFRVLLAVFKVVGGIILILPMIQPKFKEWAYAGFTFTLVAACVSHWAVDGMGFQTFFPLIILGILGVSYVYYQKLTHKVSVV